MEGPLIDMEERSVRLACAGSGATLVDRVSFTVAPEEAVCIGGDPGYCKAVTGLSLIGLDPGDCALPAASGVVEQPFTRWYVALQHMLLLVLQQKTTRAMDDAFGLAGRA